MRDGVQVFLRDPKSRWGKFRLWWYVTSRDVKDWFLRWVYAQHNARVLADMENRFCIVLCEASGNMMSKAYYDKDVMLNQIALHHQKLYNDGYCDAEEDHEIPEDEKQGDWSER